MVKGLDAGGLVHPGSCNRGGAGHHHGRFVAHDVLVEKQYWSLLFLLLV